MTQVIRYSQAVKDYLTTFYCILDEMIEAMTEATLGESISANFMVQMIPHHEAAIQMSRSILQYTGNPQLCDIASGIIREQTESIGQMQEILPACRSATNTEQDLCLYQRRADQIMRTMFTRMDTARSDNRVSCNFMWEMIPHHEGAVALSENALRYEICPSLVPILQAIITSQKRGIARMQHLLRCIGC